LLARPHRQWKQAAFSQYPRDEVGAMGYTMRTDRYRYTEWLDAGGAVVGRELYDHQTDPNENVNAADQPKHKKLVEELSLQLRLGWRAALPRGAASGSLHVPANSFRKGAP
ncbi:MAG: sulfatase/phosphatase domain-containing protein, partial [Burkholderiales bacterium]